MLFPVKRHDLPQYTRSENVCLESESCCSLVSRWGLMCSHHSEVEQTSRYTVLTLHSRPFKYYTGLNSDYF